MKVLLVLSLFIVIFLIVFLSFKKHISYYLYKAIKKKTGLSINYSDLKISFNEITISGIIIDKSSLHVEVDFVKISLALKYQFISLQIGDLMCFYPSNDGYGVSSNNNNIKATSNKQIINGLKKILERRKYSRIFKHVFLNIMQINLYYKENTKFSILNLTFDKKKIVFNLKNSINLFSNFRVSVRIEANKLLYIINAQDYNDVNRLQISHLNGKIFLNRLNHQITVDAYIGKLQLNYKKIAKKRCTFNDLKISLILDQLEDRLVLNPDSSILFNDIILNMKGFFNERDELVSILAYISARIDSIIHLMPLESNNKLKKFQSEERICIGASLAFLWSDPLSYKFNLDYDVRDLKIINPGVDLSYLNNSFSFKVTINKEDDHSINVLLPDEHYKKEDSHLLAKIIQISEDPNFYNHNGIDSYFVGIAIANNLAKKQFFKGASTISMQLIKNLFLSEEKSVLRKLEELILTLIMENYFHIPKERILNIYLQIIELGPQVYGISEASKFYFNKTVVELNLMECLVISYIVPRPRFFLDALVAKSEQLDRNLSRHIENKLRTLLINKIINKDDFQSVSSKIVFFDFGTLELKQLDFSKLNIFF